MEYNCEHLIDMITDAVNGLDETAAIYEDDGQVPVSIVKQWSEAIRNACERIQDGDR